MCNLSRCGFVSIDVTFDLHWPAVTPYDKGVYRIWYCVDKFIYVNQLVSGNLKSDALKRWNIFCIQLILCKTTTSNWPKIGFQDQLLLNAGQKYCRMFQGEHSAILSTSIKLPIFIKIFVLSIFEWTCYSGFTVIAGDKKACLSAIYFSYHK